MKQDNVLSNFQFIFFSITCFASKTMCVMMEPVLCVKLIDPNVFELQRSGIQLKATPHATLIFFFFGF